MPRKKTQGFTDVELDVMRVLWDNGPCSSDEIRLSMPGIEKRKESTMRTILGIMEKKGFIRHEVMGRTFIYAAVIEKETAQKNTLIKVIEQVFNGSPRMLLQCILDTAELDSNTLSEIRIVLAGSKGKSGR